MVDTPRWLTDEISHFMEGLRFSRADVEVLLDSQKRNINAVAEATHIATEGAASVSRRQAEILQNALNEVATMIRELQASGDPHEALTTQADLIKRTFESALANARELAEMVEKANTEAFEVIKRRMGETLNEIREAALRQTARKKAG